MVGFINPKELAPYESNTLKAKPGPRPLQGQDKALEKIVQDPVNIDRHHLLGMAMDLSLASGSPTSSQALPDPEPTVSLSKPKPRRKPRVKVLNAIVEVETNKPNGRTANSKVTGTPMDLSVASVSFTSSQSQPDPGPEPIVSFPKSRPRKRPCPKNAPSDFLTSSQSPPPDADAKPKEVALPKSRSRKKPSVKNANASVEAIKPNPSTAKVEVTVTGDKRMKISAASESLTSSQSPPPVPDPETKVSASKSRPRKKPLVKNVNFVNFYEANKASSLSANVEVTTGFPMPISAASNSLTSSKSPPDVGLKVSSSKSKPRKNPRIKNPNSIVEAKKRNVSIGKFDVTAVTAGSRMEISEASASDWSDCPTTPSPSDQDLQAKVTSSKSKPRNKPRVKNPTSIVEANKPNGRPANFEITAVAVTGGMPMEIFAASGSPTSSQSQPDPEPKVSKATARPRKKPTVRHVNVNTFVDVEANKPNTFNVQDTGEKTSVKARIINLKVAQVAGGKKARTGALPLAAPVPLPAPAPSPAPAPLPPPAPLPALAPVPAQTPLPLPWSSTSPLPVPRVILTKIQEPHRFAVPKIPLFNRNSRGSSNLTPVQVVQGSSIMAPDPTETVTETETRATCPNAPALPPPRIVPGSSFTTSATVTEPVPVFEYDAFFPPFPSMNILHPEDTPEDNLAYILNGVELNNTDGLFYNDRDAILNILKKQFVDNIGEGQNEDQSQNHSGSGSGTGDGPGQEVPQLGDDLTSSSPDDGGEEWPYWISKDIWLGVAHYAFPTEDLHYNF